MKHTRSILQAVLAALWIPVVASGQEEPVPASDATLRLLSEVGTRVGEEASEADAAGFVPHEQQQVVTFLDPANEGKPASADQMIRLVNRAVDIVVSLGVAYDSNPQLAPTLDEEWVTWADLRFLLNPQALGNPGRGFYYGFDLGSSVFSYGTGSARAGRDQGEFDVSAFTGLRGAKTDIRFSADYQLNNGNLIDFSELDREARRSDSDDLDLALSASRLFDHSSLTGLVRWSERNFNSDSGLNDTTGMIGDVGWLFRPGFAPKTELGAGFRMGSYNTDRNFEQEFYEPSFRFRHRTTAKTSFHGRVGYTFIDYDGQGAIEDNGFTSALAGWDWTPTTKTAFGVQVYREFSPSYTGANENYVTEGLGFSVSQLFPKGWSFRGTVALESADYFSTAVASTTDRQDDYWRVGGDLSHPLNLVSWLDGQVSFFYYYNANDSSVNAANFDQVFTGMKVGLSY